jgi:hypothetical protein
MLSKEDSRRLAQMERQLRRDDPEFCARMSGGQLDSPPISVGKDRPARRRLPVSLILTALVIWLTALTLGIVGWWIAAAIAAFCATVLIAAVAYRFRRPRGFP